MSRWKTAGIYWKSSSWFPEELKNALLNTFLRSKLFIRPRWRLYSRHLYRRLKVILSSIAHYHSHDLATTAEIIRAAKILHRMELAHSEAKGAVGLEGEMIDAPMIKQVSSA